MYQEQVLTPERVLHAYPFIAPPAYVDCDKKEILRVLERAARDNNFIVQLTQRGSDALRDYALTSEARAALSSGDIRWIEARVGKLDARLSVWPRLRLQQESW